MAFKSLKRCCRFYLCTFLLLCIITAHGQRRGGGKGQRPEGDPPKGDGGSGGPGSMPSGTSYCDACGWTSAYSESISSIGTYLTRVITANGCPNHYSYCTGKDGLVGCGGKSEEGTSTEAAVQEKSITIPLQPVFAASTTDTSCGQADIAIALNGVSIYGGVVNDNCDLLDLEDEESEWISFDMCSGHAGPGGDYHYHLPPSCLLNQLEGSSSTSFSDGHSPQIGWAFDGFPVYGPLGRNGTVMDYIANGCDPLTEYYCLDSCGGLKANLTDIDNYQYRYYFTGNTSDLGSLPTSPKPSNNFYPFSMKCYVGCTMDSLDDGTCTSVGSGMVDVSQVPTALTGVTDRFSNYSIGNLGEDTKCMTSQAQAAPMPTPMPTYYWNEGMYADDDTSESISGGVFASIICAVASFVCCIGILIKFLYTEKHVKIVREFEVDDDFEMRHSHRGTYPSNAKPMPLFNKGKVLPQAWIPYVAPASYAHAQVVDMGAPPSYEDATQEELTRSEKFRMLQQQENQHRR